MVRWGGRGYEDADVDVDEDDAAAGAGFELFDSVVVELLFDSVEEPPDDPADALEVVSDVVEPFADSLDEFPERESVR